MNNMLDSDDPDHARLRGLVHKVFTPRLIEKMQERVQIITDRLLDAVESQGEMELINDFAFPLPITVIAEILGVPVSDRDKFRRWTSALIDSGGGDVGSILRLFPSMIAFNRYMRRLFDERRAQPQDDLITSLVQVEEAGDTLNEGELLAMVFLLLVAGHETTVNLISNGVMALLHHPDQMHMLKDNPSLMRTAIEEMLRYDSPVELATERYGKDDFTLHGVTIKKGDLVMVSLASANRDPMQFTDPDTFDITREPNKHLAFGQGIHYCLGAPLARMEGSIALTTLLQRLPNLAFNTDPETLKWRKSLIIRGLEAFPVKF